MGLDKLVKLVKGSTGMRTAVSDTKSTVKKMRPMRLKKLKLW